MNRKFMEEAARLATESVEKGWGGPFGAVIVKDGEIIGRGQNRVLLTGCPVYHAEITAIIDASARLNPKGLLGTEYSAGTMLEMIARPPGSPDLVTERARMLKRMRNLYQWRAVPDVHECYLLVAHRHAIFRREPGGYEWHWVLRCFPIRRFRPSLGRTERD
jgi:Cytidine and deoxycytidylate deaminase zinc-binding region